MIPLERCSRETIEVLHKPGIKKPRVCWRLGDLATYPLCSCPTPNCPNSIWPIADAHRGVLLFAQLCFESADTAAGFMADFYDGGFPSTLLDTLPPREMVGAWMGRCEALYKLLDKHQGCPLLTLGKPDATIPQWFAKRMKEAEEK